MKHITMTRTCLTTALLFLITLGGAIHVSYAQQDAGFKWAIGMGSSGDDNGYAIATDARGNVLVTGRFEDTLQLGANITLISNGSFDVFVAKFNPAGEVQWAHSWGATGFDYGYGIATDPWGNVFVTGQFVGTVNFNQQGSAFISAVGYDAFVVKLDSSGVFQWVGKLGGSGADVGMGIAADTSGNVYTIGYYADKADFDPGTGAADTFYLSSVGGSRDIFISKLDSAGRFVWARSMGGSGGSDQGQAIALDALGNIYATGQFSGTAYFNPATGATGLTSSGSNDIFVVKLRTNGDFVWARNMGGGKADVGNGIAANESGVYTTGSFAGDADFDPGPNQEMLSSNGGFFNDIFVSKLDTAGNYVWAKAIGGDFQDQGNGIALDASGNVYTIGNFFNTVNFNPGGTAVNLSDAGGTGIFLLKSDEAGNFIWAKAMGSDQADEGEGIAIDGSGNVLSTGSFFDDRVDFDPGTDSFFITSNGRYDIFVQKLGCTDTSSSSIDVHADCKGYLFHGELYTQSGTYTKTFHSMSGCDSIVTLHLTVGFLNPPVINVSGFVLGTVDTYAHYQWMLNGNLIPGATDSVYTVHQNGDYQVIVSDTAGCTDTSDVYTVTNAAIEEVHALARKISIYPNPATESITIQSPVEVAVTLTDVTGRVIKQVGQAHHINISGLASGLYLLRISDRDGNLIKVSKMVKRAD